MRFFTFLSLIAVMHTFSTFGQSSIKPVLSQNCYRKWAAFFEEHGVYTVVDTFYEDVVVTIRKGENSDCFYGRVWVIKGKIDQIRIKFEDGTYTDFVKKYKYDKPAGITNGISTPRVTMDDEIINILFVMNIKPKRKSYARAPDPEPVPENR